MSDRVRDVEPRIVDQAPEIAAVAATSKPRTTSRIHAICRPCSPLDGSHHLYCLAHRLARAARPGQLCAAESALIGPSQDARARGGRRRRDRQLRIRRPCRHSAHCRPRSDPTARVIRRHPVGAARPEEIAPLVAFLCPDATDTLWARPAVVGQGPSPPCCPTRSRCPGRAGGI